MVLRGRFAPSPSGYMHLGNAWTALLAWLDIRRQGGVMVLRMENLDPDRSRPEYEAGLLRDLAWLGLDWDEGPERGGLYAPYRQSERGECYHSAFESLERQGLIYPCYCSRAELRNAALAPHAGETEQPYSGRCQKIAAAFRPEPGRRPAFRLKVGDTEIGFRDELYGWQQQVLAAVCGDFVLRRADGVFAYQLAVVVDDISMRISRIVRGADLLASTPRQIYLWNLLGAALPSFLHVPLLLGADGSRLSKRHGSLTLTALRENGIAPEQIVGQLAFWAGLIARPESVRATELIPLYAPEKLPVNPVVVSLDMLW